MINDITIGQYFPGNSFLHRLDPRMKIVLTFLQIIIIFVCKNFVSLGIVVALTFLLVLLSKISFKVIAKSLKPLVFIILFTSVLNMLYGTGDALVEFWIFKITLDGISNAVFMSVRIICLIVSSSLLTYTTTPTSLTDAIESLLKPLSYLKIDVHTGAMIMTIALRFIPTLIEEIDKIMKAQKSRGADMESGNLIKRAKALVPVLIPLFVSSFRRASDLAYAMECRCYQGGKGRTKMKKFKLTFIDYIAPAVLALVFAAVIASNYIF